MLSFGDPAPFADRIKRAGARLLCQVQTLAMAQEAAASGADILVAQGAEGGGHGVARGLITLLPEIVDVLGGRIPVVACGGLADGRGLAAGLMLGASGAMFGTRFYASQEAAGADAAKERIRAASGDDSLRSIVFDISRRNVWPAPFTGRCLRNPFLDRWYGHEMELVRAADVEAERVAEARRNHDFDVAPVIAGEAAGLVREILPAREIVDRIVREAENLLARDYSRAEGAISS
jgi:nitronate monooxygenase